MKFVKAIILIVIFVFAIIFVIQNREPFMSQLNLKFNFLGWNWSSSIPVYSAILFSFVIGAFLVLIYFMCDSFRKNRELKVYRERIEELEDELNSIQSVSFDEEERQYQEEVEKEPAK